MRVFFLLNAKTKTEGGESYLQFGASIKMQIVGNHFSALTMEALSLQRPKTARRMDPPESTAQNPLSLNWNTHRGDDFILSASAAFHKDVMLPVTLCARADVGLTLWWRCHCLREGQGLSINQYVRDVLEEKILRDTCVEKVIIWSSGLYYW